MKKVLILTSVASMIDQFNMPKEFLNAYYRGDVYYLTAEIHAKDKN